MMSECGMPGSKLIFFLTLHNSCALNGPVVTHVQLVNRMHPIASGSTRLSPHRSLAAMRDSGVVLPLRGPFRSSKTDGHARNEGRTGPGMHIMRPIPKDGEATEV